MPGLSDSNARHSLDWDALDAESSEFSWGNGLMPKGLENAPPSLGGRYHGQQASRDDPPANNVKVSNDYRI